MVSMSAVWDRTTTFVAQHFGVLSLIALIGIFVPTALDGAISPLKDIAGPFERLLISLVSFVMVIVTVWASAALVAFTLAPTPDAAPAWRRGLARLPAFIGVGLALVAALLLLALPVLATLWANGVDLANLETQRPDLSAGSAAFLVLYCVVMIPLFFWPAARLMPLSGVVVNEERGLGAISRTWRLTRSHGLRLFGVMLLYGIVLSVATLAAQTVFGSLFRLILGGEGSFNLANVLTAVVVAAVSTVFSVLVMVFSAFLYRALADREAAAG